MKGIHIWLLSMVVFMISCGRNEKEGPLTIATAANMQFAMEDMIRAFEAATDISCELVVSSSGKLTAQIHEGAPFDVLVSADMKYPEDLYKAGLTETPPQVYAYGKLVLWSLQDSLELSLQALKSPSVHHVALANPETAPYGKAALEVLQYHGIYQEVREKLVFGESIAQTNQFIISKAAEVGFTAMSVVLAPRLEQSGHWVELDPKTYHPIAQGLVVIRGSEQASADALAFRDFLFSAAGKKILTKFGYLVDE